VTMAEPILEEPLQVIGGPNPIGSILGHPLGLNIQQILEDLDFESEDSVVLKGDNIRQPTAEVEAVKALNRPLSPISEAGTTS
jgi:hypothetical protein